MPNYWCGPFFCRASEPIRTLYRTAFNRHIREQDVRHLKFDNFRACCYNSRHDHLPGLYSTEAIEESVMQTLREYSETCPDVFIFLYWGYRSPWWLLHGDVLFEPGLDIEAASPGGAPTLYVRDGVTVGLDQAQWWCHDLPALGKDSLGVWLSDWPWNSSIGSERWQEGFVMDLCRGSLLAQPWSDWDFLTPPERAQLADFITLLRAQPTCFANPRFILGNPWRNEPYGYCCGDGTRLFLALNNCTWDDALLSLDAVPAGYELYRWYPDPAKLEGDNAAIAMRPFAVVLLEAVPAGTVPSIDREFAVQPLPTGFAEPSRTLPLTVSESPDLPPLRLPAEDADVAVEATRTLQVTATLPDSASAGTFALTLELFDSARLLTRQNPGQFFAALAMRDGEPVAAQPVVRESGYPCGWQAWRVPAPAGPARNLTMTVTVAADEDVTIKTHGYFIPQG
ncbi:MAG: hypothetical protein BWY76_00331 [bacterium ADurb.Bin429]|nr:MAG: hypothetical protein BWY76_00331 [bacterium ADurb.Bin429]